MAEPRKVDNVFLMDDDGHGRYPLRLPLPEPQPEPQEPTSEVMDAVREAVTRREQRGISVEQSKKKPYRIQADIRRQFGIEAPVEQVAGALARL